MTLVNRILPAAPIATLDAYLAAGGGRAVDAARRVEPEVLIAEVEASGLRGRGGAGFPTGTKWRTIAANRSPELPTTVVVNAAEGEPGTYKDRTILRADPYSVLEGALVAAIAGGAEIVVALKDCEPVEHESVTGAIDEMRVAGLLGDVDVKVVTGPHEYLFGEETALLEVVDGRPPLPRIAPPYRRGVVEVVEHDDDVDSGSGLPAHVEMAGPGPETMAPPARVDNVETLANVAHIVADGAAWFRSVGGQRARHRRTTGTAEAVTPVLIAEVTSLADGKVTLDESRRTKQPDWTHDDQWSGSYPADELADHREDHQTD
jgi:NADH:ubiquinone oxidoreductase subunit F (NADH-binding)